jgi:hypothetical protein
MLHLVKKQVSKVSRSPISPIIYGCHNYCLWNQTCETLFSLSAVVLFKRTEVVTHLSFNDQFKWYGLGGVKDNIKHKR